MNLNQYFEHIEKSNIELEMCIQDFLITNKVNNYKSISDYINHLCKHLKKNRFDGEFSFEKKYSFLLKSPELALTIENNNLNMSYYLLSISEDKNIIPEHFEHLKLLRDTNLIFEHNEKYAVYKKEESLPCFFDIELKSMELKLNEDFDIRYDNLLNRTNNNLIENSKSLKIKKKDSNDYTNLIIYLNEKGIDITSSKDSKNMYFKFLNQIEANKNKVIVDFITKECDIEFIDVLINQNFIHHPSYKEKVDFEIITEDESFTKNMVEKLCGILENVSYQMEQRPLNYSEKLLNSIKKRISF